MVMRLYIATSPDGKEIALANITPENAEEMKAKGWDMLWIGLSRPETMSGALAHDLRIDGRFAQNTGMVRL